MSSRSCSIPVTSEERFLLPAAWGILDCNAHIRRDSPVPYLVGEVCGDLDVWHCGQFLAMWPLEECPAGKAKADESTQASACENPVDDVSHLFLPLRLCLRFLGIFRFLLPWRWSVHTRTGIRSGVHIGALGRVSNSTRLSVDLTSLR